MLGGIFIIMYKIAVVIYSVHVYKILVSGHNVYYYVVYVFSCGVCAHACSCACVCTCLCKPQYSLAEHASTKSLSRSISFGDCSCHAGLLNL